MPRTSQKIVKSAERL